MTFNATIFSDDKGCLSIPKKLDSIHSRVKLLTRLIAMAGWQYLIEEIVRVSAQTLPALIQMNSFRRSEYSYKKAFIF